MTVKHSKNRDDQTDLNDRFKEACHCLELKDFGGAYKATLALSDKERGSQKIKNIIQTAMVLVEFKESSPQAEADVMRLLEDKLITEDEFYRVAQQLVGIKLGFRDERVCFDLEDLKSDHLFIKVLTLSHIRSDALVQAVSIIRHKLLTVSLAGMELPDHFVGLAQALAIQSMHLNYAQKEDETEVEMINELQAMLENVVDNEGWNPLQVEGLFLLLCLYRRLYDLPIKEKLLALAKDAWPESLKQLVNLNLYKLAEQA